MHLPIFTSFASLQGATIPQTANGINYHHPTPEGGFAFFMPNVSLIGPGALQSAAQRIQKLGFKKALIVTDADLSKCGAVKDVTDVLNSIGVSHVLYDKTIPNPTDVNVSRRRNQRPVTGSHMPPSRDGWHVHG
jgi:alcohol dehydrogenase